MTRIKSGFLSVLSVAWFFQGFDCEGVELAADGVDVGEGERVGVGAVCQEDEDALVLGIDPERGAREAVVTEAVGRQISPAG